MTPAPGTQLLRFVGDRLRVTLDAPTELGAGMRAFLRTNLTRAALLRAGVVAQAAFIPLLGLTYTPGLAAVITLVVVLLQAVMILLSTTATTKLNNFAVAIEIVGVVLLVFAVTIASLVAHYGRVGTLWSTGVASSTGWYRWLGPFMLATLLGAYTIVGFESSANLAEETLRPRRVVPVAMIRAVVLSGVLGMAFLIALSLGIGDVTAVTNDSSPVAAILRTYFGGAELIVLSWMCVSIFACGTVIMVTNSRLIWAMARDRRFPGHQLLARTPRATGGPSSTLLAAAISGAIVVVLWNNTNALITLFSTATLMPAILYTFTVLLYLVVGRRIPADPDVFGLGRWERPVVGGALVWLAYELVILLGPAAFRPAQKYALGAAVVGAVVYLVMRVLEPGPMRTRASAVALPPDEEAG